VRNGLSQPHIAIGDLTRPGPLTPGTEFFHGSAELLDRKGGSQVHWPSVGRGQTSVGSASSVETPVAET
jgi:hypothetical protein